jgi:hypothetical protein
MKDHLAGNIVTMCPIWKIISRDGLVAAYAGHTRATKGRHFNPLKVGSVWVSTGLSLLTFNGTTYRVAPSIPTRDVITMGMDSNSTQITGMFDDLITRRDVETGRWKLAKIVYEYVNYLDLTMSSTGKIIGVVGQIQVAAPTYQMEFLSNSSLLQQQIGELTSPTDRNPFPAGVDPADWQHVRHVVSSTDRRNLVIDGTAMDNGYFDNGVIIWQTGANYHTAGMEIKANVGNNIELQLPMAADITGEFINAVFKAIYDRVATSSEHSYWETTLHAAWPGTIVTVASGMLADMFHSDEYAARKRGDLAFVIDTYAAYFARFPDTSGLNYWMGQLELNGRDAVLNGHAASSEFSDRLTAVDPSLPGSGDTVMLVAGYDGTLAQMRDRYNDAIDMNAEPFLPGMATPFSYPE